MATRIAFERARRRADKARRTIMGGLMFLAALHLGSFVALANPIKLLISGEARNDGKIGIEWTGGLAFNGQGGLNAAFAVKDGQSASSAAGSITTSWNNAFKEDGYTATHTQEKIGSETVEVVIITPGAGAADFNSTKLRDLSNSSDPKNKYPDGLTVTPTLVRVAPAQSKVDLNPNPGKNPDQGMVDWKIWVLHQDFGIVAFSERSISNELSGTDVASLFASDFQSDGLPVTAQGDSLNLFSPIGDFFEVEQSDVSPLIPFSGMTAVPEPSTPALVGVAVVCLMTTRRGRRRFASK